MDRQSREQLNNFSPLSSLDEPERRAAIERGEVRHFEPGEFLFRQAERNDEAYFLLEGEIETLFDTLRVRRLKNGERAASEEFGAGDPRPVSARALTEVRTFVIRQSALSAALNGESRVTASDHGEDNPSTPLVGTCAVAHPRGTPDPKFSTDSNQGPDNPPENATSSRSPVLESAGESDAGDRRGTGAAAVRSSDPSPGDTPDASGELEWMRQLMRSELFRRIPAANVHRIITLLENISVSANDVIIQQVTIGDYYFFIRRGRAQVTRKTRPNAPYVKLAERVEGQSFGGEEALVSDAPRNATVTMLTDGELMRLSKKSFIELIQKPTLNSVSFGQAQMLVRESAVWVDVRFAEEHALSGIDGSINVPLDEIRNRADEFDTSHRYVVYCDSGRESSAGAFLLTELGFDVCYLAGGLLHTLASIRSGKTGPAEDLLEIRESTAAPADDDVVLETVEDAETFIAALEEDALDPKEDDEQTGESAGLPEPADGPDLPELEDQAAQRERVALEASRHSRLLRQLAEVKMQLLASMRLKSLAERAHIAAEKSLSGKVAELRSSLAAQTERADALQSAAARARPGPEPEPESPPGAPPLAAGASGHAGPALAGLARDGAKEPEAHAEAGQPRCCREPGPHSRARGDGSSARREPGTNSGTR